MAAALGLGVILVVGNTIRLAIQSRRDEIVTVVKLVGGTDAYVRRPFLVHRTTVWLVRCLYCWQLLLIGLARSLAGRARTVNTLAGLYQSQYSIGGLGLGVSGFIALLRIGGTVGLAGAWI